MAISKISLLPLSDLYARKITPSVEAAIHSKEDFSKISPNYCETVCKLKCKNPKAVRLLNTEVDILIIQDHEAPNQRFDRRPGAQEAIQKNILDFMCVKAGFAGLTYRVVNLLKCASNETDFPKGKPPSVTTISKCRPYLYEEIKRCKPKAIISLSTAVTKVLGFKKHSNTANRGEIVSGNIVITLHPRVLSMIRQNASGKLWGNDYFNIIKRDFEKAAAIARGTLVVKSLEQGLAEQSKNITICRNLEDVRRTVELITSLPDGAVVSCDTETTGLDPMSDKAKILCIQFGWRDPETKTIIAHVIPLWHRTNTMFNPDIAWKLIVPILVSEGIQKAYHNGKFDILYIWHTKKVRCKGTFVDTMLGLHAMDSGGQGTFSLKAAIWDFAIDLGIGGYENLLEPLTKPPKVKKTVEGEESDEEEQEETEVSDE